MATHDLKNDDTMKTATDDVEDASTASEESSSSFCDEQEGSGVKQDSVESSANKPHDDNDNDHNYVAFMHYCRLAAILGLVMLASLAIVLLLTLEQELVEEQPKQHHEDDVRFYGNPEAVAWHAVGGGGGDEPTTIRTLSTPRQIILSADAQQLLVTTTTTASSWNWTAAGMYQYNAASQTWDETFRFALAGVTDDFAQYAAMSASGNRVALSSQHAIYVYDKATLVPGLDRVTWKPQRHPIALETTTSDLVAGDVRALHLSADGSRLAVGLPQHAGHKGQVRLYSYGRRTTRNNGGTATRSEWTWELDQIVTGQNVHDNVGSLLQLTDTTLVDGTFWADTENGVASGQISSWHYNDDDNHHWQALPPILGLQSLHALGDVLALSANGQVVAAASPGYNDGAGAVWVYKLMQDCNNKNKLSWQPHGVPLVHVDATGLCLSADGNLLTLLTADGTVQMYQKWNHNAEWQAVGPVLATGSGGVLACAGRTIAVTNPKNGAVQVYVAMEG